MGDVLPVLQAFVHFATAYSQAFIPEFTRGQPLGLLQTRFERGEKARCFTTSDGAMIEGEG